MRIGRVMRNLDRRVVPVVGSFLRVGRHRRHKPMLGGVLLLTTMALVAAGAWLVSQPPPQQDRGKVQVGVSAGQSVPDYVERARRALDQLAGSSSTAPVYALASFTAYRPPSALRAMLAGVEVSRVYVRVPAATSGPVADIQVVQLPSDVTAGMDRLATDRQRIADDFGDLATTAPSGSAQRTQYRHERHAYQTEASGYRRHCACVFAAVLRGTPAALLAVAGRAGVRAVDPAPGVASLSGAVFTPPLPEQTGDAVPPDAGTASPAPGTVSARPSMPPPSVAPAPPASASPSPSPSPTGSPSTEPPSPTGTTRATSPSDVP